MWARAVLLVILVVIGQASAQSPPVISYPQDYKAILLMYTGVSIATTFAVTAGMFGALAVFGSTTKRSLAGAGHFFFGD